MKIYIGICWQIVLTELIHLNYIHHSNMAGLERKVQKGVCYSDDPDNYRHFQRARKSKKELFCGDSYREKSYYNTGI